MAPNPAIVTRASWGARRPRRPPALGTVEFAVVHHTAIGALDGWAADSAAAVRAIQNVHMLGNGWDDIGYHLLVDGRGLIYEGRAGGVGRPLVGAHAIGANRRSTAVAVIGDFSSQTPSRGALAGLAVALAHKLGPLGLPADATTIRGHDSLADTMCPGAALSACLPGVRRRTAQLLRAGAGRPAAPAARRRAAPVG